MPSAEMQLISRIVRVGDIAKAIDWGVTETDFRSAEARSVWRYIAGYYTQSQTRGAIIGPNAFAEVFPQLALYDDPSMTTESLCHEIRRYRIVEEVKESVTSMIDNVELDPAAAISTMHAHLQRLLALGDKKNHDLTIRDAMDRIVRRYNLMKTDQWALSKLTWPWAPVNDFTGGIQQDDYVVIYGRPKQGKTWIMSMILAWAFQMEKTALFYTKEMTPENLFMRIAACIARLPYHELRNGRLLPQDEQLLLSLAQHVQDKYSRANLICLDGREAGPGGDNIAWLQSKVEKYKPDILFIDGMYLLSDASQGKKTADWQRVTNISRGIREMILHTQTPVIATMQANRAAAKHSDGNLDEIAYADAVSQDATMAMRVISEHTRGTIACVMAGSREFKLDGFRIHNVPATNFEFHSIMSKDEVTEAEKNDVPDEQKKKGTRKPRTRGEQVTREVEKLMDQQISNSL